MAESVKRPPFPGIKPEDVSGDDGKISADSIARGVSRALRLHFEEFRHAPTAGEVAALQSLILNHGSRHSVPASPGGEDPLDVGRLFDTGKRLLTSLQRAILTGNVVAVSNGRAMHGHGPEGLILPGGLSTPPSIYDQQILPGTVTGAGDLTVFQTNLVGGSIEVGHVLWGRATFRRSTGAGAYTVKLKLGSTTIATFGATAVSPSVVEFFLSPSGSLSAEACVVSLLNSAVSTLYGTAAEDISVDKALAITADLATDTDVLEPIHYVLLLVSTRRVATLAGAPAGGGGAPPPQADFEGGGEGGPG